MRNLKLHIIPILFGITILSNCTPKPTTELLINDSVVEPYWVQSIDYDHMYIYGKGSSDYMQDPNTTMERARVNAINMIGQQIKVSVKSSIKDSVWEVSGINQSTFERVVESIVESIDLSNIEIVDTWIEKPDNRAWCYVRLDKNKYEKLRQKQRADALHIISAHLSEGDYQFLKTDYSRALFEFLTVYYYSQFLLGDYNQVEYPDFSGEYINLDTELSKRIADLFNHLEFEILEQPAEIKAWDSRGVKIKIRAYFNYNRSKDLVRSPITIKVTKSVQSLAFVYTNNYGIAECWINSNDYSAKNLSLTVQLELDSLKIDRNKMDRTLDISISSKYQAPFIVIDIPVQPLELFMSSNETIDGQRVRTAEKFVTKAIEDGFTSLEGFVFVRNERMADYTIKLDVHCDFQSMATDFFWYNTNISIEVRQNDGAVVFSNVYPPIKGFGLSRKNGGKVALQKAGIITRDEIVSEMISHFTNTSNLGVR